MKIATNIIVAAALVLASAPAFAHGGGMGGMGHGNGMTNTSIHEQVVNGKIVVTKTTKTSFFNRIEVVRLQREIRRLDREIKRLIKDGKGNSQLAMALQSQLLKVEAQRLKLTGNS
jgi:hypothetical protein